MWKLILQFLRACFMRDLPEAQQTQSVAVSQPPIAIHNPPAEFKTFKGIDVYHGNGAINWKAVADSREIDFAYVKMSEGDSFKDPKGQFNLTAARAAGIPVGVYCFYHPGLDPQKQLDLFINQIQDFSHVDLIPWIDWEVADHLKLAPQCDSVKKFADLLQAYCGAQPIIYSGAWFFDDLGELPELFKGYRWCISDYRNVASPRLPKPLDTFILWQTSENGTVPGIEGKVDIDIYKGTSLDPLRLHGS